MKSFNGSYLSVYLCITLLLFSQILIAKNSSQIDRKTIKSKVISIYLPAGYSEEKVYKTVYFLDGKYIFKKQWGLKEILDRIIANNIIEPIIVVGIHETKFRRRNLTVYYDKWIQKNSGNYRPRSKQYSDYIHKNVIPLIESNYSVLKQSKDRALFGLSMGGLFSTWDASVNSNHWGMVAAISPSYWVKDHEMIKVLNDVNLKVDKFWFDIGTAQNDWNTIYKLIPVLQKQNFIYGKNLFYYEAPRAFHAVVDWAKRIENPFIVFAGKPARKLEKVKIAVDYLPIDRSKQSYQRINPIMKYDNGLTFSASYAAEYEILNPEDGEIINDGVLKFNSDNSLNIRIKHKDFEQDFTVENIKTQL
jgi:enterochelin esterase-like enzyme